MEKLSNNRKLILLAAVFLQFTYGIAYVWSVFQPYVKKNFVLNNGQANMPFGVLLAMFSLGNILAGALKKHWSPRYIIIMGNGLFLLGLLLCTQIPNNRGELLVLTYGVMTGLGAGVGYNTTIATVQKWFPDKRGFATGVLICATGSFGLIMNPIANIVLSKYGFSYGVYTVTAIVAFCMIIGNGWIKEPKDFTVNDLTLNTSVNYTVVEVLKLPQYYLITLTMMLAVPGYMLLNPMLMTLGAERGLNERTALYGVMLVAIFNTFGRLIAPWISDKLGRKNVVMLIFVIDIMAVIAVASLRNTWFLAGIGVLGFAYGGFMGIYPAITADYFGIKNNGSNYGLVMIGYGISSIACPYLVKAVQASAAGEQLSFFIAAAAGIIGLILIKLLNKPRQVNNRSKKVEIMEV
jgi:OFA family oxalate/formate antiporter-like MFS transporter